MKMELKAAVVGDGPGEAGRLIDTLDACMERLPAWRVEWQAFDDTGERLRHADPFDLIFIARSQLDRLGGELPAPLVLVGEGNGEGGRKGEGGSDGEDERLLGTLEEITAEGLAPLLLLAACRSFAGFHPQLWQEVSGDLLASNARLLEAKRKAEEASVLKDKFVSLVAHDLRNPLTTLLGALELALRDDAVLASPRLGERLERAVLGAKQMEGTIREVLDISRLKTGKVRPRPRFFSARAALEAAVAGVAALADGKQVVINNRVAADHRLFGDPVLIREVLQNLLSNAVKFSRPGGVVDLYVEEDGAGGEIAVRDDGVGIDVELLPKLFRLEEKVSTAGTAGESGIGFGLPLSHDIMSAHGGALRVESALGAGSTFYLTLPDIRPRVMLVEDSLSARMKFRDYLKELRVEVAEAGDGVEALERLELVRPHLILTDLHMPGMDGFELLGQLKRHPVWAQVPVIVITSDGEIATRDRVFRLGAADFVTKPVVANDFIPRLRRHLGGAG